MPEPFAGWLRPSTAADRSCCSSCSSSPASLLQVVNQLVSAVRHAGAGRYRPADGVRPARIGCSHISSRSGCNHHITTSTGDAVYRVDVDAYAIENLAMSGVFPLATSITTLVGDVRRSWCALNVTIALLSLTVVPFLFLCLRYYATTIVEPGGARQGARIEADPRLYETFSAIRLVKSFAREPYEIGALHAGGRQDDARADRGHLAAVALFGGRRGPSPSSARRSCVVVGGMHVMRGQMTVGAPDRRHRVSRERCTVRCRRLRTRPDSCRAPSPGHAGCARSSP